MDEPRTHRARSADGTEIVGRAIGQGPPLVLVHGGPQDGESAWDQLVPLLADRRTCYLPSVRGRGRSGDHPDHSPPRLDEDITAFVDSIGEPVDLLGWSQGATRALGVAAQTAAVRSLVLFEPFVLALLGEHDLTDLFAAVQEVDAAAADGRPIDASRAFHAFVATDAELAAVPGGYWRASAGAIAGFLAEVRDGVGHDGPRGSDPEVLAQVGAPVLALRGGATALGTLFAAVEDHLAQHLTGVRTGVLDGVGHLAPLCAPEAVAPPAADFLDGASTS